MVRRNLRARSRNKVLKEQILFWGKKKPRLWISRVRSNSILQKAGELGLNASAGHDEILRMHLVRNWIRERKKGNLEALSKKVNLMSEILARPVLRNEHLRKPHDKQIVTAKSRGIWRDKCTMRSKSDLCSDGKDTSRRRSRNPTTGPSRDRERASKRDARGLFTISICSWQCDYSMENASGSVASIHCARNHEIGETSQLANNWKSTTCTIDNFALLLVPRMTSIPAAGCLQHQDQRISKFYSRKLGLLSDPDTTRSDKYACGKPMLTGSWQAGHGKPWICIRKKFRWDCTRRIQRKIFLFGCSPSQFISRTWRIVLAHSSERANSDSEGDASKVEIHKRKHYVHACFRKNQKKSIMRAEEELLTWKQQITKVNLGLITSSLSWCKTSLFTGIRFKPKRHRRRRRICESSLIPRSQKVIHTDNLLEFGKYCEELSWNHRTILSHRLETRNLQKEVCVE